MSNLKQEAITALKGRLWTAVIGIMATDLGLLTANPAQREQLQAQRFDLETEAAGHAAWLQMLKGRWTLPAWGLFLGLCLLGTVGAVWLAAC